MPRVKKVSAPPGLARRLILLGLVVAILVSACGPAATPAADVVSTPAPAAPATAQPTSNAGVPTEEPLAVVESTAQVPAAEPLPATPTDQPEAAASPKPPTTAPTDPPTPIPTAAPTPVDPPVLPEPPAPLALGPGAPEEQAPALAAALLDPQNRLAAWLGVYDALSIPVIGQDGRPVGTTADDPIGPTYWQVWYASVYDLPGRGILLTDAGRLVTAGLEGMDGEDVGAVLLDDLRGAAQSQDPQVRLFGLFVRERMLQGSSHADLLDPATTPLSATIDLPTIQLLGWVAIRGLFAQDAQETSQRPGPASVAAGLMSSLPSLPLAAVLAPVGSGLLSGGLARGLAASSLLSRPMSPLQQASGQPCSAAFGDEDVTYWVNWIANKLGGGLQLPGMEKSLPGTIGLIQKHLGKDISVIEKTAERMGWVNALAAALTLAMQLSSLDISGYEEPDPLIRTKKTADGDKTTVYLALSMDPGSLPDGNNGALCFLSFLTNALGTSFSFPAGGRISGAEVTFKGAEGFPDLVLFGDYKQLRQDTDDNGEVKLTVLGRAQKKDLPDSVKPVDKEFSVLISAQPEPVTGNTISNIFVDGLTATSGAGVVSGIVDILKTFHWDLGEQVFRLTDWKTPGYRYYFNFQGIDVKEGIICSFEKPFVINAKLSYPGAKGSYQYTFTPSSPTAGTVAVVGSFTASGGTISLDGDGTYTIQSPDTETPLISVKLKRLDTKGAKGYGHMIPEVPGAGTEMVFDLEPLQTNECGGQG